MGKDSGSGLKSAATVSWEEWLALAVLAIVLFAGFASIELSDKFADFAKRYKEWELDEVVLSIPVLTIVMAVFTINRIIQLRRETRARIAAEVEARRVATVNPVTGLPNETELLRLAGESGGSADAAAPAAAFVIRHNLRRKALNSAGESEAREALDEYIRRLRMALPLKAIIGNLDNDSLLVFAPGLSNDARGQKMIDALMATLAAPVDVAGLSIAVRHRVGVAFMHASGVSGPMDAPRLFRQALSALENQPLKDLSSCTVFDPAFDTARNARRLMFQQLRIAIEKDETECAFQPIIDLQSGATVAFEALARWTPKGGEPVPPDVFIPMLEKAGLIDGFTDAVLDRALRCARALPEDVGMAVNVSRLQLMDPQLYMRIFQRLQRYGITARRLELEVTETEDLGEVNTSRQSIVALRALGVKIAIDDFGAGFSNLHMLHEVDFDRIKIDRKFISDIRKSPKNRAIVEATIAMAASLRRSLTAEGIEDEATAELLKQIGCERGQGYYFGKPMSADEAVAYVKRRPGPGIDFRKLAKPAEAGEKPSLSRFGLAARPRGPFAQPSGGADQSAHAFTPRITTKG
jgi:predicted signal transduction protein with EAL and GGDEF domain